MPPVLASPMVRFVVDPILGWLLLLLLLTLLTVTLILSDDDFGKLVQGEANPQRLFMSGKLKIKGDIMKATKLDPIMKKAKSSAKL